MATLTTLPLELRQLIGCLDHKVWMRLAQVDKRFYDYAHTPEGQRMFEDMFSEVRLTHIPHEKQGWRTFRIEHFLCGKLHRQSEPAVTTVTYESAGEAYSLVNYWWLRGKPDNGGMYVEEHICTYVGCCVRTRWWNSADRPRRVTFARRPGELDNWRASWGDRASYMYIIWDHPYDELQWDKYSTPPPGLKPIG